MAPPDEAEREDLLARGDELIAQSRALIAELDRALARSPASVPDDEREGLVPPGEGTAGEHTGIGIDREVGAAGEQFLEDDSAL